MKTWLGALVAATLIAGVQEPVRDVDSLLDDLQDDSIIARDGAAKELIRRGDAVREAVRSRMKTLSGDPWGRHDRVLMAIDAERRRRQFKGMETRVSLTAKDRPLSDVLVDLEKATETSLSLSRPPTDPVTVDFKDVSPVEALDRIAGAAGRGWGIQWSYPVLPDMKPQLMFLDSKRPPKPLVATYAKNFRVALAGFDLTRSRTPQGEKEQCTVGGVLQPWPGLGPVVSSEVQVDRIVDDQGRVLFERKVAPHNRRGDRLEGAAPPLGNIPWMFVIKHPAADAKSVSVLGGRAVVRCEVERKFVSLEASEKAVDRPVEYEGLTIRLASYRREGKKLTVGIAQSGRRTPRHDLAEYRVAGEANLDYVELRLRDGTTARPVSPRRLDGKGGAESDFVTDGEPVEIRLVTYTVWEMETIDFEFRDVPLP